MKRNNKKRKLRYGSVTLLMCIFVIACAVILNIITGALCLRYDWMYIDMSKPPVYDISDACREYIDEYVISEIKAQNQKDSKIKIYFCDTEENIKSVEIYKYVYDSFFEIEGMFDEYIEIDHLNIWEKPSLAAEYGVTSTQDIVCVYDGRHETMNLTDFYIIENVDYQSIPTAYNGEKIIASCLMRVTQKETPVCYMTVNHGELYGDYEFMKMMAEAGYAISSLDLYTEDIPEDCDILVSFNPKKDLAISGETSIVSEVEKLDRFMSAGGKYMIFLSADTFASGGFANLEGFLSEWGIQYMHMTTDENVEACYLIKDSANSLTVDGYTVLSENAQSGIGSAVLRDMKAPNAFGNATCISVSDEFEADGNGNYVSSDKKRTVAPLLLSHSTAIAWADGRAVARAGEGQFMLMSMTEQKCDNGKTGYLIASASVDFASEDAMRSSVLGNSRTLTEIVRYMGKENAPSSLVFKPFGETDIQSLTSRNASILTVVLVLVPLLLVTISGTVVLIRRRGR